MTAIYGEQLAQILSHSDPDLFAVTTPEIVFQAAQKQNRERFAAIIEDLLLPGSGVEGVENLRSLHALAAQGRPALILSAHVSNLDVPALYTLLKHRGEEALFEDIIFIAGRKLTEGCKSIKSMAEMFSRVVISAKSSRMSEQEISVGMAINKAAQRKIAELQGQREGVPALSDRHEKPRRRAADAPRAAGGLQLPAQVRVLRRLRDPGKHSAPAGRCRHDRRIPAPECGRLHASGRSGTSRSGWPNSPCASPTRQPTASSSSSTPSWKRSIRSATTRGARGRGRPARRRARVPRHRRRCRSARRIARRRRRAGHRAAAARLLRPAGTARRRA